MRLFKISKCGLFALLLIVFCLFLNGKTFAQSDGLVLEWEQHWDTYGVGGTCNFGTHNFFVGDVDNDGVMEIVTGGFAYNVSDGNRGYSWAPFKIWNWNGENFTLEKSYDWAGSIGSIYAGDSDGDGLTEIITGGRVSNITGSYSSLRIWSWDDKVLALRGSYEGVNVRSIFVCDVDKDGVPEILTAGRDSNGNKSSAQLCVWQWDGNTLALRKSVEWCAATDASANSVYAYDLNNDGEIEIITGGYDNDLTNSSGQLRIWHWNGEELSMKVNEEWRMVEGVYGSTISGSPMGNTLVNNLKVGDVDGDGIAEIVTGGFTYDGEKVNGQLRIWNWTGHILFLEKSHEWITEDITEVKAMSLNDVDGDEQVDVVTSGMTAVYGSFFDVDTISETAQLRVWSWNGKVLTLKQNVDWVIGEGVMAWNVATGDVDDDGTVEILTVGCMYISTLCDPDLRIWS
ncbi:VCBS repeat-containing protein, partial [Candidatus Bathyarchaeota archaeon]|nr:VCBS repeat-containing protein [Candidatus Bathyarchaeota archaeon]